MAILLVVGLAVADFVTYASVSSFLYGRADNQLASSEAVASNYLSAAAQHHVTVTAAELSHRVSPDLYLLVVDARGHVLLNRPSGSPNRPDPRPIHLAGIPVQDSDISTHGHFGRHGGAFSPNPDAVVVGGHGDPGARYRAVALEVPQGTLYTALSLNPTQDTLASLRRIELLASIAVVVVMGALALWLVRRGLRPLADMAETADAIASGDLARRVPEGTPDTEVGRLGTALNEMLTQIEGAFDVKTASEERLRQFVADASHELRTPLTSIRGYAELLRRGGFSDEASKHKALQRIEEEATRMGGLVEDLLLLAELDRGRPLRCEPVELRAICADAVDDASALDQGHRLLLDAPAPVVVTGDPERLAQVAHNLVRNAVAHTPSGTKVTVSVGVRTDEEHPRTHAMGYLRVRDTGPGIDPQDAERIFDRFYRGDPSRTGAGTGLGLAIVRAIAEALGGTAVVEASLGGGASFVVWLPLADVAQSAPIAERVRLPQTR